MVKIFPPAEPLSVPEHQQLSILICHPGYDDRNNVLFSLYASDLDDEGNSGLYAQFALDACAIITEDYAGRGWLSLMRHDSDGNAKIDPTSTLQEPFYYFHLPGQTAGLPYAIVPSFRQWRYPHYHVPQHWKQLPLGTSKLCVPSNLTTSVVNRDQSCRLSGHCYEPQVAHVVPQSELDWWKDNQMSRYTKTSRYGINHPTNALLLRADLHLAYDRNCICFVPKPTTDGTMRLVAHLLDYAPELEQLYHNHELHPTAVGFNMLYARFAWFVFTLLDLFLSCPVDRRFTLLASPAGLVDERGFVSAAKWELFTGATKRNRSRSSTKTKTDLNTIDEHEDCVEGTLSLSSSEDSVSLDYDPRPLVQAWIGSQCQWSNQRDTCEKEHAIDVEQQVTIIL